MTMLAKTETRALTLADYEARIHLYKEQIGTGYIGIGRTLIEAKEAEAVPHGQWEDWVTRTTGLTVRQAQKCMQAAREIRDGSAMARLEMSKALMLLGSGLDEEAREQIASAAAEEGATVKALREEIRQAKLKLVQETGAASEIRAALKKAEGERESLRAQLQETIRAYQKRMDDAAGDAYRRGLQDQAAGMERDIRKEFQGKIDYLGGRIREAESQARDLEEALKKSQKEGGARWDEGYRAGRGEVEERDAQIRELKTALEDAERGGRAEAERLRRNQGDLLAAAEEAEKRAADAEAELEQLRAGKDAGAEPAAAVLNRALTAFLADCELMPWYPEQLRGMRQPILESVASMETWCQRMRAALDAAVPAEGAVR